MRLPPKVPWFVKNPFFKTCWKDKWKPQIKLWIRMSKQGDDEWQGLDEQPDRCNAPFACCPMHSSTQSKVIHPKYYKNYLWSDTRSKFCVYLYPKKNTGPFSYFYVNQLLYLDTLKLMYRNSSFICILSMYRKVATTSQSCLGAHACKHVQYWPICSMTVQVQDSFKFLLYLEYTTLSQRVALLHWTRLVTFTVEQHANI